MENLECVWEGGGYIQISIRASGIQIQAAFLTSGGSCCYNFLKNVSSFVEEMEEIS